jgi:hypothetical protein
MADFILYPKNKEDFPTPDKEDWYIIFADSSMLDAIDKHGRLVCGVDGCYKFTKYVTYNYT